MCHACLQVVQRPGVRDMLLGKLLVGLGGSVFQSLFPVVLQRGYGLEPRDNGMVLSYVGVLLLAGGCGLSRVWVKGVSVGKAWSRGTTAWCSATWVCC